MESLDFEERNHILNGPKREFEDLFVNINPTLPGCPTTFKMRLSPAELEEVIRTGGDVYFTQMTGGNAFQPVSLSVIKPPMEKIDLTPYFKPREE